MKRGTHAPMTFVWGRGYSEGSRVPDYFKLSTILTNFECNDLKNKLDYEKYGEFYLYSLVHFLPRVFP